MLATQVTKKLMSSYKCQGQYIALYDFKYGEQVPLFRELIASAMMVDMKWFSKRC